MTEFESIYREYFRDVYLYILGLSRDEHIAEEVTQETFFRAMKAIKGFRGDCDIRVWLCQVAKNEYFSYLRKNKRMMLTDFSEEADGISAHDKKGSPGGDSFLAGKSRNNRAESSIEQQLIDSETAVRIHRLLHNMQEPYKEVFQLRVFGELSFEQIGSVFEKSANWACVTYHRARNKIQKEMEEK